MNEVTYMEQLTSMSYWEDEQRTLHNALPRRTTILLGGQRFTCSLHGLCRRTRLLQILLRNEIYVHVYKNSYLPL